MKTTRTQSVAGIVLGGGRISVVVVRRNGAGPRVRAAVSAAVSLDPFRDDPEVAGREIREILEAAGIRERNCVVCIPAARVLFIRLPLPEMPDAEVPGFLALTAEQEFGLPPEELGLWTSRFAWGPDEEGASLAAVPGDHLVRLRKTFAAARMRVLRFTTSAASLPGIADMRRPCVTLSRTGSDPELAVGVPGGIAALRSLPVAAQAESGAGSEATLREIRITLGQLPEGIRSQLRTIQVCGEPGLPGEGGDLSTRLLEMGLVSEPACVPDDLATPDASAAVVNTPGGIVAATAAARWLAGQAAGCEFRIPVESRAGLFRRKYGRRLVRVAVAAGIALLALPVTVAYREWRIRSLESRWEAMAPSVAELEQVRETLRSLSPWVTRRPRSLELLRVLATAFPEAGTVWAGKIEVEDFTDVTVSGKTRDKEAWFAMQDRLGRTPGVTDLRISQTRESNDGRSMAFVMSLRFNPRTGNAE